MTKSTRIPPICDQSQPTFGEFMRRERVAHHITMRAAADALGWSAVYLSDIERGLRSAPPDTKKIDRWAFLIGADLDEARLLAFRERQPELAESERQRDILQAAVHDSLMILDHDADGRTLAEAVETVVHMLNDALEAAG